MKKLLTITLVFTLLFCSSVSAENRRIVDNANKLSESQIVQLENELDSLSDKYGFDIVVYLSNDTSYSDDVVSEGCEFYDNNNYGYGEDHSGILLIINYEVGMFSIITTGQDVRNKYDGYIEDCYDALQDSLRDYPYDAIEIFEYWIDTRFIDDNIYIEDDNYVKVEKDNTIRDLSFSSIVATLVCLVVGIILKSQLKTEGKKHGAKDYINKNSFNLTRSGDIFLYRTTTRRRIKTRSNNNNFHNSSGSGFSTTHVSSHGISHGTGGSRKF